jgi:hypothetical protein
VADGSWESGATTPMLNGTSNKGKLVLKMATRIANKLAEALDIETPNFSVKA